MNNEKIPYTLCIPTAYGPMLINRHDINQSNALIKTGFALDKDEIEFVKAVCANSGDNCVALDIGANFGVYSIAMGHELNLKGGKVYAFEPQRILANMISGSIALNSLENVFIHQVCVGNDDAMVELPNFDYSQPLNFGSIEFGEEQKEVLNQVRRKSNELVSQVRIDDFQFTSVCFIKIDVEGMEERVLYGANNTIKTYLPICLVEYQKSKRELLLNYFKDLGYRVWDWNYNYLCIHPKDAIHYKIGLLEI